MKAKKTSTRPSRDELRQRALDAAEARIAADGYAAVAARDLAKAAGCSVGTLYNVFGDLDGVIYAVNLRTARDLRRALDDAMAGAETPERRLFALADAYFDFAQAHPKRWEALFRFRAKGPVDGSVGREGEALFALLKDATDGAVSDEALLALWAAVHGVVELAADQHLVFYASGSERRYLHLILKTALGTLPKA